jgi:peptidoglycan-N-acetylglucosamine deacetylase
MKHLRLSPVFLGYLIPFLVGFCVVLIPPGVHAEVHTKLNAGGIALTFDACENRTPACFDEKILSCLIEQEIPFTIFMTGKFALRNRERLKEISKLPFVEIENHSYSHHQHMERMTAAQIKNEVTALDKLLVRMTGKKTKYFRFPAGNYDEDTLRAVERMHYKAVGWTYESGDPNKQMTPYRLIDRVTSKTQDGDILIFHINGRGWSTGDALPLIIENLREKGFNFIKLEDGGF